MREDTFHAAQGKRTILVVDDELINREILGMILEEHYHVLYAVDGAAALAAIREHRQRLSLVLLDLLMPGMNGKELLEILRNDKALKQIPVIVMTSDQTSEVECLKLGAIDFVPKPYPQPAVIAARVERTIELSEDRQIIDSTERDPLTGLYNREYFYRYAQQFDQSHGETDMDALLLDINHFHMLNERYGKAYGDEVLRRIAEKLRGLVNASGGIACRREADTFLVYCPHGCDYQAFLDTASAGLAGDASASDNRVRLRLGVYSKVDKHIDIERRFDRAKSAADTVRNNFVKSIAVYDDALHQKELYAEQLLEDFQAAIRERQFVVYYQPKFDVRPEIPVLASAEALVRWKHPELGLISPGIFIPLFEENGLIQQLDMYVWREAAAQIRSWRERFGITIPVSVNVSRIDMYDPDLIRTFRELMQEYDLTPREYLLEITESAYTQDSEQIISTVKELRRLGFRIEMDDFGTGYSSLNMISSLPIDALKLDMTFIRNAFNERKDIRMLELILDIADYLAVPVIAEGVETETQLNALRAMGCDMVQGYYFSRPVPPEEYEQFIRERKKQKVAKTQTAPVVKRSVGRIREKKVPYGRIAHELSGGFETIYYVEADTGRYVQFGAHGRQEDLQITGSGEDFFGEIREQLTEEISPEDQAPVFAKIIRLADPDDRHLVIGISDVDDQINRERAFAEAQEMALKDPLTGVKNKRAYEQAADRISAQIKNGHLNGLGLVMCDINNLKVVNDTQGHEAGDVYIRECCLMICHVFTHSPVFRLGGDEFAVILQGQDYENRDELLALLRERATLPGEEEAGKGCMACGLAEYLPQKDTSLSDVFARADRAMYEEKTRMKAGR